MRSAYAWGALPNPPLSDVILVSWMDGDGKSHMMGYMHGAPSQPAVPVQPQAPLPGWRTGLGAPGLEQGALALQLSDVDPGG